MGMSNAQRIPLLRKRDGDNCQLCGKPIDFTLPPGTWMGPSVDHIIPKAASGHSELANRQLAHAFPCNHKKASIWQGVHYGREDSPYGIGKHYRKRSQCRYGTGKPGDGADWETPVAACWPVDPLSGSWPAARQ